MENNGNEWIRYLSSVSSKKYNKVQFSTLQTSALNCMSWGSISESHATVSLNHTICNSDIWSAVCEWSGSRTGPNPCPLPVVVISYSPGNWPTQLTNILTQITPSIWSNPFNAEDEGSMFPRNVAVNAEAHSIRNFTLHWLCGTCTLSTAHAEHGTMYCPSGKGTQHTALPGNMYTMHCLWRAHKP